MADRTASSPTRRCESASSVTKNRQRARSSLASGKGAQVKRVTLWREGDRDAEDLDRDVLPLASVVADRGTASMVTNVNAVVVRVNVKRPDVRS